MELYRNFPFSKMSKMEAKMEAKWNLICTPNCKPSKTLNRKLSHTPIISKKHILKKGADLFMLSLKMRVLMTCDDESNVSP